MSLDTPLEDQLRQHLLNTPKRQDLVPPPRFADKTFDSYRSDDSIEGQSEALSLIHDFSNAGSIKWWQLGRRSEKRGLYLDGDFGVGKTHLLAAIYHRCPGSKTYLSFAEAMSLCIIMGAEKASAYIAADIVCIDEFELDDPSNTRFADLLIDKLIAQGCRIVVTSNTVPGELGQGRMAVDSFRSQLVRISECFADVHVPGKDFRQQSRPQAHCNPNLWSHNIDDFTNKSDGYFRLSMEEFDKILIDIPIINLRQLAKKMRRLFLYDVHPCKDQLVGLRFVHAIDKFYDYQSALRVDSDMPLEEIFLPEYRDWAFAKKYRRCTSRLSELCSETQDEAQE